MEIGCFSDENFDVIKSWGRFSTYTGVDPEQGGTIRATSDDFFANALRTGEDNKKFDVVFIDGLHEADQVFRDISNSLHFLSPNGTILLHDSNPRSRDSQNKTWTSQPVWVGDTWKAVVAMRLRPDVEVVLFDFDHGVAVVRKRENKHPLPREWVDFLSVSPISMLDYDRHYRSSAPLLHRYVTFEMATEWLDEEFRALNS